MITTNLVRCASNQCPLWATNTHARTFSLAVEPRLLTYMSDGCINSSVIHKNYQFNFQTALIHAKLTLNSFNSIRLIAVKYDYKYLFKFKNSVTGQVNRFSECSCEKIRSIFQAIMRANMYQAGRHKERLIEISQTASATFRSTAATVFSDAGQQRAESIIN